MQHKETVDRFQVFKSRYHGYLELALVDISSDPTLWNLEKRAKYTAYVAVFHKWNWKCNKPH